MSTRKPTILQILPALESGGVERGTVEIARALVAAGFGSIVVSEGGKMVEEIEKAGAKHIWAPLNTKNPFQILANSYDIADIVKKHDVDILHARSRAPAWSALLAARRWKKPFVTTFHGVYKIGNPLKKKYNSVMVKGHRVIAVSEFIARHIRENYGADEKRLRVIERGVDLGFFAPGKVTPERSAKLADEWRVPPGKKVLLLPGRLARWKGQGVFIEALKKAEGDFYAVILGDASGHEGYCAELEAAIEAGGLAGRAVIMPAVSDMPAAYSLAEIVVAPSTEPEAFGRVPLEAQAMGRLVIAANHGGARDTVENGHTGILVQPRDTEALAHAITHLLRLDPEKKSRMQKAAMEHASRFPVERMCDLTLKVYREF